MMVICILGNGHKVLCLDWRERGRTKELLALLDTELDYIIAAGEQA